MPLLEVNNLKTFFNLENGQVARAVDGVSFSLEEGKTLCIVGESGCGKSQTAFSIVRLLEPNAFTLADSEILYNNIDLLSLEENELCRLRGNEISMIFQEPMQSLNPLFTIGNHLIEPLLIHKGLTKQEAKVIAIDLLNKVGIPDPELRYQAYPHELSGGMKQRVMIAMALACKPNLLIADEPTTALDVTTQAQVLDLLKDMQDEYKMGMIFITHDMGVVNIIADYVCVMYGGKVVEYGSKKDIFTNPQHPYTRNLLKAIPVAGNKEFKLTSIPGTVPSATVLTEGCRFAERCDEVMEICYTVKPNSFKVAKTTDSKHCAYCHLLDSELKKELNKIKEQELKPLKDLKDEILLKVNNLNIHFPIKTGLFQRVTDHVKAVNDLSFEIKRGETLVLVGESGCGKSTTAQAIMRLIPYAVGDIFFNDINLLNISNAKLKQIKSKIQIVFQDPFTSLSPRLNIYQIISEGLEIHYPNLDKDTIMNKVISVLNDVGLNEDVLDRFPHEFSGGQRQRIAIARALILEPELLILDEPTSALDVSVQAQILNLLNDIQSRTNITYLFITHDLGVVEYIADNVAVMYFGDLVEYGSAEEVLYNPKHSYTKTLLSAVPKI